MEHLGLWALVGGHKTLMVGFGNELCPLSSLALYFLAHSDGRYCHLFMLQTSDAQPPCLARADIWTPETVNPLKLLLSRFFFSVTRKVTQ